MYIEPNTTIRLLHSECDPDYENTLYFANATSQLDYFLSQPAIVLEASQYQRRDTGVFRCPLSMSQAYNKNYMMFKNTSFENKWFFAFITKVEYVNNGRCDVYFEIDVMQTWFIPNVTLDQCFIERQHVADDSIGANILPEPVETGEYVFNNDNSDEKYSPLADSLSRIAYVLSVTQTDESGGGVIQNIFTGSTLYVYADSQIDQLIEKIQTYDVDSNAITSLYCIPYWVLINVPLDHIIRDNVITGTYSKTKGAISTANTIDGYHPRNNKLYTYPFNFVNVDNANGSSLALRYEFFDNLTPSFKIYGCVTQPVQEKLMPVNYKNSGSNANECETLIIDNFPLCSWNTDSYQAYISGAGWATDTINVVTGALMGGAMIATGNLGAGLATGLAPIANALKNSYLASIKADVLNGGGNSGGANTAYERNTFNYGRMSITYQYAESIDHFFDMFGYAVNTVDVPNISSRPEWNYVKTIGCSCWGDCPADDLTKIKEIFNNGVRFWKNPDHMGNYDYANK